MKERVKSLKSRGHSFATASEQIETLHQTEEGFPTFGEKLKGIGLLPLKPTNIDILQVNVGKMCNQVCKHCHVDAGPDRKEIMTTETIDQIIDVMRNHKFSTLDLTGGAPEMNPHFRYFVENAAPLVDNIIVRCNLTIIVANKKYYDLPEFYKKHNIEVVSSLPHFTPNRTDSQRGEGVFEQSIRALKMLNEVGYGIEDTGLKLNLVYNPTGSFLPGNQEDLEKEYKRQLSSKFDISFNNLFAITNLPVSRFLDYLVESGNYEEYMDKLLDAFNPMAAAGVMCRNTLSISWDGYIYDCDFNQMLDLKVACRSENQHISNFNIETLQKRSIIIDQHCYGCTAGAGSSCGGQTA